jgi:hypothetical protein
LQLRARNSSEYTRQSYSDLRRPRVLLGGGLENRH